MALNPNHAFEELEGVKCSIVEKNVSPARVEFLKKLLELNGFTVVVVKSPPPKAAPVKPAAPLKEGEVAPPPAPAPPPPPETFTVGVTDLSFDPVTAVYNRQLKTADKKIVDIYYWKQEVDSPKEKWYWEK